MHFGTFPPLTGTPSALAELFGQRFGHDVDASPAGQDDSLVDYPPRPRRIRYQARAFLSP
jgi:hypothetical protein